NCATPQFNFIGGVNLKGTSGGPQTNSSTTTNVTLLLAPNGTGTVQTLAGSNTVDALQLGSGGPGLFQAAATTLAIQSGSSTTGALQFTGTTTQLWNISTRSSGQSITFQPVVNNNVLVTLSGLNK